MFNALSPLRTLIKGYDRYRDRRERESLKNSYVSFSDSTGPCIAFIGIGDLLRSAGNVWSAALYRISADRVAVRIFNEAGVGIATYIGDSTSPGAGDELRQLALACLSSTYITVRFVKNSTESFSPSIGVGDATSFCCGVG